MTEEQCHIINITLYVIATFVFKRKFGWKNLATLSMLLYTISSILAFMFFLTPFYYITDAARTGYFTLEPALWLFAFNYLLCLTLRNTNIPQTDTVYNYDMKVIDGLQFFLVFVFSVIVILGLPGAISNFLSDNLSDLRLDSGETIRSGPFFIRLLSRFLGGFSVFLLVIPVFNYFVLKRKRKIDFITLLLYFGNQLVIIGNAVSRATIIIMFIEVSSVLFCLRVFIPKQVIKKIIRLAIPSVVLIMTFFVAVSVSRFSESYVKSASEKESVQSSYFNYGGQGFLNFDIMMYDKTNGCAWFYSTFTLYRRLLGLPYSGENIKTGGKSTFAKKIHPYPSNIFYQVAGRWYKDMGKYLPIPLLIIINIIIGRKKKRRFTFLSLVIVIMWNLYVMIGIFWALYGSEAYNMLYIYLLILYASMQGKKIKLPQRSLGRLDSNKL